MRVVQSQQISGGLLIDDDEEIFHENIHTYNSMYIYLVVYDYDDCLISIPSAVQCLFCVGLTTVNQSERGGE